MLSRAVSFILVLLCCVSVLLPKVSLSKEITGDKKDHNCDSQSSFKCVIEAEQPPSGRTYQSDDIYIDLTDDRLSQKSRRINDTEQLTKEQAEVRDRFIAWKTLIRNVKDRDQEKSRISPDDVLEYITDNSLALYKRLHNKTIYGDQESIATLPLYEQVQVMLLRVLHEGREHDLLGMYPDELIAYAINENLLNIFPCSNADINNIIVNGDKARADVFCRKFSASLPEKTSTTLMFKREFEGWKLDIETSFHQINQGLEASYFILDPLKVDVVITILERKVNRQILPQHFKPLIANKGDV